MLGDGLGIHQQVVSNCTVQHLSSLDLTALPFLYYYYYTLFQLLNPQVLLFFLIPPSHRSGGWGPGNKRLRTTQVPAGVKPQHNGKYRFLNWSYRIRLPVPSPGLHPGEFRFTSLTITTTPKGEKGRKQTSVTVRSRVQVIKQNTGPPLSYSLSVTVSGVLVLHLPAGLLYL